LLKIFQSEILRASLLRTLLPVANQSFTGFYSYNVSCFLSFITPPGQHTDYYYIQHKRLKLTKNELYAENMSMSHLPP